MHRTLRTSDLEFPVPISRKAPSVALDEDFCLPMLTGSATPPSRPQSQPKPRPQPVVPAPERRDALILDEPLDDFPTEPRPPVRSRRAAPPRFVPFEPETFQMAKDPWGIYSLTDLFRFFLPELSISTALMTGCGLIAGRLLAHWTGSVQPLWVLGIYLAILFLHIGGLYLAAKGGSSAHLKPSMRNLVLGLFLLLLPHSVACFVLSAGA